MKRDGLTSVHTFAYSIGHLSNDFGGAQWFVFGCWFMTKVVGLDPADAGLALLVG